METTLNGTEGSHSESLCEVQRLVIRYHHLIYNLQTPSITNCIQTRHMPIHLSGMLGKPVPKSVSAVINTGLFYDTVLWKLHNGI